MPKLKPDSITAATLDQYLAANDDFAFELKCLRELRKRPDLKIAHAGTYSDPVTNKSRQFDFRVEFSPLRYLRIAVALECKNLKLNFPLLISRLPRRREEAFHQLLMPSTAEARARYMISHEPPRPLYPSTTTAVEAPPSPYAENEPVGKSTAQIGQTPAADFYSDDSEVYDKWAQAVNSAYGLIANAHDAFSADLGLKAAYFIVPAVVVPDGTLWVVDYQADGTVVGQPKQVAETTFYINQTATIDGQTFSYAISHLHFMTLSGMASFIDRHLVNSNFHRQLVPVQ